MTCVVCGKTNHHALSLVRSPNLLPETAVWTHALQVWEETISYLILDEVGRVLQVHLFSSQRVVMSGQGQAPQGVTATAPLPNDRHDLLFDSRGHGNLRTPNSNVGAPVDDTFRSTLEMLTDSHQQLYLLDLNQDLNPENRSVQPAVLAFTNILLMDVRLGLFGVQ